MFTPSDVLYLSLCLEAFLYGIYSGIFAIYLQLSFTRKEPRTTNIVFYALCLLYALSTATFASDLPETIIFLGILPPVQLEIDIQSITPVIISQITINGCCDFISQCILIYRCWIVWGKNIWVIIIPSFLAITYLATWLAAQGGIIVAAGDDNISFTLWGNILTITGLTASMVVNALVTGLIVFKILKVFIEVKPTSVEQTLGSFSSTGGPKLRNIMFIIIESGMALFAIQLVRVVLSSLAEVVSVGEPTYTTIMMTISIGNALNMVIPIHQVLNGITPTIILVRVQMGLSFKDEESFKEAVSGALGSLNFNNPPSESDSLQGVESMPPQERNEDICFDNLPSDPNIILEARRVPVESNTSSSSSAPEPRPEERSEDT